MPLDSLITENGAIAQALLRQNTNESEEYDTIVIGSGMGGGVVASALADEKKKVLVLEAGSLLFPTHIGNLPRRLFLGKFQKHIWSLWDRFQVKNYNNVGDSRYNGAQGFNLGGRSIFWGSSIPELAAWELDVWPEEVQKYLLDTSDKGGYALARGVYNSDVPELKPFHYKAVQQISQSMGKEWEVLPAPVAVEYSGATEWSVPAGIFSTADLLLEDGMADYEGFVEGRKPLTVNLNHPVWNVEFDKTNPKRATGVRCWDAINKRERVYRANSVVISAGTLESAKIALRSEINNPLIGRGICDHPIFYRHFVIPPEAMAKINAIKLNTSTNGANGTNGINIVNGVNELSVNGTTTDGTASSTTPPRLEAQSTKLLMRHRSATMKNHAFDIVMELGANFNQGRYVDPDHIQDELIGRKGYLLCEIVFQFYAPLMEDNYVRLRDNDSISPVNIYMKPYEIDPTLMAEARQVATKILREFNALSVIGPEEGPLFDNDNLAILYEAALGGVAHEVGTLRMPVKGQQASVLDKDLKFVGYENLFACDNSVFPCSPCGNPSLTLVALARRCAKAVAKLV